MFKRMMAGAVCLLVVGCGGNEDAASNSYEMTSAAGQYIIMFNGPVNRAAIGNAGGQVLNELLLVNGLTVLLPEQAAVNRVRHLNGVKSVEPDVLVYTIGKPQPAPPPPQSTPWGVTKVGAPLVWGASRGAGINVAIIDTGIDPTHPDLAANLKGGVNFVFNRGKVDPAKWADDNGHGTHVAGAVAALDNTTGVVGIAPSANLYAVKVLNKSGSGYMSDVIAGIDWAVSNGMQVANMSLGSSSGTTALETAVNNAYALGLVLVAAAGNSGDCNLLTDDVGYPAKYASVIAVAATASDNSRPCWSSDGPKVELSAPGVGVLSTYKGGGYATLSGTSMATPHVTGAVALLLSSPVQALYDANTNLIWDPEEVRAVFDATATDLGDLGQDNYFGYGLIDMVKALGLTP
jgi:subtilisin